MLSVRQVAWPVSPGCRVSGTPDHSVTVKGRVGIFMARSGLGARSFAPPPAPGKLLRRRRLPRPASYSAGAVAASGTRPRPKLRRRARLSKPR